jgi:type IV pilus assembly protein PilW
MNKPSANHAATRERGVTLVELLVSLVLGMLLTAGIIQVFAGNRTTYAFNESLSRIQENARFTLDHIAYEARMAGYSGCLSEVAIHNNLELDNQDLFRDDIANGIQGYDANGTGAGETYLATAMNPSPSGNLTDWTPSLPAQLDDLVLPGSDVLVVRGIGGEAESLVSPFNDTTQLFVSTPHDLAAGQILVVSDCQKASIFQLSAVDSTGRNLTHGTPSMTPGNENASWGPEQDYGLGSEVARLNTLAFYVGRGADGSPALFQLRLQSVGTTASFAAEELAAGVETLQVRYGIDSAGADGAIDEWVSADAIGDWTTVLSVEIALLARADDEYGAETDTVTYTLGATQFNPINDRRLREVFSTTVGVRNRLP